MVFFKKNVLFHLNQKSNKLLVCVLETNELRHIVEFLPSSIFKSCTFVLDKELNL